MTKSAWVPGDPLPLPGTAHVPNPSGVVLPLMQAIDDDGLDHHEPHCWCRDELHPDDCRAMRWRPGLREVP